MRILLFITLLLSACGEFRGVAPTPEKLIAFSGAQSWQASDLANLTVQEFTVIVFKEKIPAHDWKNIFHQTKKLSTLRTEQATLTAKIRAMNDEDTSELEEARDAITLEITDILSEISDKHASYLINWGEMQKCKFSNEVTPSLQCKHLPKDAPQFSNEWKLKKPDPKKDLWVFPWIETELKSRDWNLVLKLKPETRVAGKDWVWSGELEATGTFSQPHDRYGYVEMRLR